MTDVPVKFVLTVLRPDQRQYRQQEVELVCQQELQVLVPLTNEMIANSEDVIQAKLGSGNVANPNPILTVAGLKYVIDQFDDVFLKVEEKPVEETTDKDWDELPDDGQSIEKKSSKKANDENWDELPEIEDSKEVPWDEDNEKWE